ncbi:hypothetical protein [Aurantiacibacter poecillastricola]|uniref:hypothetical protein n=1 Tax=Aurantiacibacter poecillastricola TaxID=3064385 RepID=UPI00273F85C6|nr:hypothetical protein [Aurantiacibacter sp. 219JJ12-13]MDP5260952.1 hypothetical protein [Aurantiacibacter sp. 219JJ12-13]
MNWRQGFSALAIRATTLFGVGLLLYAAGRLALDYVPRFGMAPCETSDSLYHISNGVEAILLVAGLLSQIRVWRCSSLQMLIAAISAPVLALLVQYAAVDHETSRQQKCQERSLSEAMASCKASAAYYRRETDQYGYDVLTLVAPGTTDAAWSCLTRWSDHNGSVSMKIDESVYHQARSAAER